MKQQSNFYFGKYVSANALRGMPHNPAVWLDSKKRIESPCGKNDSDGLDLHDVIFNRI